tara:strand:- start:614 stop:1279 length:666 start_codon:yes stop_codon:yes gene_type:complete
MRSALLLPGHVRAYKQTFQNQFEKIIKPNNCDIFISTSTVNTIVDGSLITPTEKNSETLEQELREFYRDLIKGLSIEEEGVKSKSFLATVRDNHPDRSKQWKRLLECNQMRKKYEEEHGFKYDFVIRSRTDLLFTEKLKASMYPEHVNLFRHFDNKIEIHDQFAFSGSDLMDIYCDLISAWQPRSVAGRSEKQLHDWLRRNNVSFSYLNNICSFQMLRGVE